MATTITSATTHAGRNEVRILGTVNGAERVVVIDRASFEALSAVGKLAAAKAALNDTGPALVDYGISG